MLELRRIDLTFKAGTPDELALFQQFDLEIAAGSFVSVIGSNGSGKTSLLNLICGTLTPDRGDVLLQGKRINRLPEYKRCRRIGRVFQDPARGGAAHLSVRENLALAEAKGSPFNLSPALRHGNGRRYKAMLEPLGMGLENRLDQQYGELSGGQRQALSLLMAVMGKPLVLILDEHTAALDPKSSETVMVLTERLLRENQLTGIMVTHNLNHALRYGDRLLMMHEGRAILDLEGKAKQAVKLDEILERFNQISIERGN